MLKIARRVEIGLSSKSFASLSTHNWRDWAVLGRGSREEDGDVGIVGVSFSIIVMNLLRWVLR